MSKLDIRQLKIILLNKNNNREVKEMVIEKVCSCGKPHNVIPEYALEDENGYWWNCVCTSTLFYPKE